MRAAEKTLDTYIYQRKSHPQRNTRCMSHVSVTSTSRSQSPAVSETIPTYIKTGDSPSLDWWTMSTPPRRCYACCAPNVLFLIQLELVIVMYLSIGLHW